MWRFANGTDHASVKPSDYVDPIKSVGHGATSVVDLETNYDVWLALLDLAQDVGHRLRASELAAKGVQITVKDNELMSRQYQMTLDVPTRSPLELAQAGFALFQQRYQWLKPVRAITIRGINLVSERQPLQLDVFCDYQRRERRRTLDDTIDDIRHRYGQGAIFSASLMGDRKLAQDKCDLVMMPGMMYS